MVKELTRFEADPKTVELCALLIEFRANGLSPLKHSPVRRALMDTAAAIRELLLKGGEE